MPKQAKLQSSRKGTLNVGGLAIALLLLGLAACSSTKIQTEDSKADTANLPKPDQLVVFDFAISPDEVELNHGLIADVRNLVDKEPRTKEEKEIGRAVANALATKLVAQLREKGLPAVRAKNVVDPGVRPLQVKGQLLSVDEGNRASRVVIGLGVGRSSIEAHVQIYESVRGRAELLERMQAWTKSGRKPGMAESLGVGALTGHLLVAGLAGAGLSVAGEKLSANVDALAGNMAKKLAEQIVQFYEERGWR